MLSPHGMLNPHLSPRCQVLVDARNINKVETEKVECITGIKQMNRFQMMETDMVKAEDSFVHIPPHTLYSLIVDTFSQE